MAAAEASERRKRANGSVSLSHSLSSVLNHPHRYPAARRQAPGAGRCGGAPGGARDCARAGGALARARCSGACGHVPAASGGPALQSRWPACPSARLCATSWGRAQRFTVSALRACVCACGASREAEESVASLLYHGEYSTLWSSPQRLLLGSELTWTEPQVLLFAGMLPRTSA
jgi:hypothetical protein